MHHHHLPGLQRFSDVAYASSTIIHFGGDWYQFQYSFFYKDLHNNEFIYEFELCIYSFYQKWDDFSRMLVTIKWNKNKYKWSHTVDRGLLPSSPLTKGLTEITVMVNYENALLRSLHSALGKLRWNL